MIRVGLYTSKKVVRVRGKVLTWLEYLIDLVWLEYLIDLVWLEYLIDLVWLGNRFRKQGVV